MTARVDRAALVRRALLELVAERGFRGTSMASVAERAGVAIGTAYVHYHSNDELVLEYYVEQKQELSGAGARAIEPDRGTCRAVPPAMARYLPRPGSRSPPGAVSDSIRCITICIGGSRTGHGQHRRRSVPDCRRRRYGAPLLVDLPMLVLYDLGIGPAVRMAAAQGLDPDSATLNLVAAACWRAISKE